MDRCVKMFFEMNDSVRINETKTIFRAEGGKFNERYFGCKKKGGG